MNIKIFVIGAAVAATMTSAPSFGATNLIANGDFSAGLDGWTETNSCCYYIWDGFHEGAIDTNGMLSQTFSDSVGSLLKLTFDYGGDSGYQFVTFDGVIVPGSYVSDPSAYEAYSFILGQGTGLDTIVFNGMNDPDYNTLDNVSVVAIPEPSTWAVMALGFATLAFAGYRKVKGAVVSAP